MYRRNELSIEFKQFSLILALVVAGASQSHAWPVTAHVEVVNSTPGEFVPLEIGASVQGYMNTMVWSEFPPLITERPLQVWRVNGPPNAGWDPLPEYGIISFNVLQTGPVWLAITDRFGGGGYPSADWIPELTSRAELEAQCWSEITRGMFTFNTSANETWLEYIVFERQSFAGESFTYRTEKYCPPLLLTTQFNQVIPEPTSIVVWSIIGLSFVAIGWWRRSKRTR